MKKPAIIILTAVILSSPFVSAQDREAGKASDGVTNKSEVASPRTATPTQTRESEPGKASDAVAEKVADAVHKFDGKITAVDQDSKMVTIEDKKMGKHMLHIGGTTKLMKGSGEAKWGDVKVGDNVTGTCTKKGEAFHAETFTIGG